MPYEPIENYAMIGDLHTIALVSAAGSVDWFCAPHFDSPSVFARMLDHDKGGYFSIKPTDEAAACKQFYWPETNVLVTRFLAPDGAAEMADFMPVGHAGGEPHKRRRIIRRVRVERGTVTFRADCLPAFDFARAPHEVHEVDGGVVFRADSVPCAFGLASTVPLTVTPGTDLGNGVGCTFTLDEGESAVFAFRELLPEEEDCACLPEGPTEDLFRETVAYWRDWISHCTYTGRWRETVHRSALALKLMTFEPTGAIVAAPTCSLPEEIGGERNWDYRYTWIRDAAFTVYAFLRIGFKQEAGAFMEFLANLCSETESEWPLQIMYGIDGRKHLAEEELSHLEGYRGTGPVRMGNGAYDQLQLDIYGELLDAIYIFNKWAAPISYDLWLSVRRFVEWVCENWDQPDEGVWEIRTGRRHFVYSKVMCWVAIDRALRLAEKRSFPHDRLRWLRVRDSIYEDIMAKGWNAERGSFVQSYGSDILDAANLIMPLVFFMAPTDPRMLSTLRETLKPPKEGGLVSDSLVYRYNRGEFHDGLEGEEGTFNICTFWLVEALTRAGRFDKGCLEDSRIMFERMLGFANHVGLYGEEIGPSGEALGNFPQAFTHLSLISAAVNLDRALGGESSRPA
ncbi:Glucoamylase [Caenispirillum salinarum AK4]|uniref:Glucoamylase n=1 Tax=Caenispirillum salinarum AK4 TaxID=1238182 RepID=K9GN09_9PROT|nr:glycoside hydrolase family 15 protein [Caenispirillum salinarum]EKV27370.1 Glucoamylase [Caenispirillum salinarum AK4]